MYNRRLHPSRGVRVRVVDEDAETDRKWQDAHGERGRRQRSMRNIFIPSWERKDAK